MESWFFWSNFKNNAMNKLMKYDELKDMMRVTLSYYHNKF